jgi:hypothetical protein
MPPSILAPESGASLLSKPMLCGWRRFETSLRPPSWKKGIEGDLFLPTKEKPLFAPFDNKGGP